MKNPNTAEIKNTIMEDLFADVNTQTCVIDLFLQNPKTFQQQKDTLHTESVKFFNKCRQRLQHEADRGNILFFRKYDYEKILNLYLSETYRTNNPGLTLFLDESESRPLENGNKQIPPEREKSKPAKIPPAKTPPAETRKAKEEKLQSPLPVKEKQKTMQEKKQAERKHLEQEILTHVTDLKWKKMSRDNETRYETFYCGKRLELCVTTGLNEKQKQSNSFSIEYDGKKYQCKERGGNEIISVIVSRIEKMLKKVKREEKRKKRRESQRIEIENKKREESIRKAAEAEQRKAAAETRRIRLIEQEERMRRQELEELGPVSQLPRIGIKDFLVRRDVFKCMHAQHTVKDLDAAVTVIGDDGKTRLVQISAGYCEQCNIYFILESTYEKLRSMGVVLCRISDEKAYLENPQVNGMQLAQESILMQYGYTVSQTEGLTSARRQKILAVMIDNKIITKSAIISYLDFFIRQRKYQSKYELAVSKWEEDREFVREYHVGQYTQYGVNAIYRR